MKELIRFCGVAVLIGLLQIASAEAIVLSVDPSAQIVDLGDSTTVDIVVSDLLGEIVSAFDLDITYDASIIQATDVSFGPLLGDPDAFPFETFVDFDILTTPGLVDLAELSLLSNADLLALQPDEFTLATITFGTVGVGTSDVHLVLDDVNDFKGLDPLVALTFDVVNDGEITVVQNVNQAPEPGTIALFGTGLVGMLGYGWYRRKEDA